MKRFTFILLLMACNVAMAQNLRVMTYNIRLNIASDGVNAWPNRADQVSALLDFHQAEIFGLQEAMYDQIQDIEADLPKMKWVGVGRDDGQKAGEFSPIFYDSEKFKALKNGGFWLSETPDQPSKGWDAAFNRVCTWIILREIKTGDKFMVFNTHFDHMGLKAKTESAKLIIQKIKELNKDRLPVILMGDFNSTPETEAYATITGEMSDSRKLTKKEPYGPEGTFNSFNWNAAMKERIDYVFVSDKLEVKRYAVLTDSKDQRYPSDHQPVLVVLELKDGKKK
ncbi:MAG TPA: endonuclease/exonuclease/phosphatase family protein [Prolixibacteraceae bacterium]|nr:endonuclease/exonuclease/phosphatase family protein [Prolixibacteraceae bacterium]